MIASFSLLGGKFLRYTLSLMPTVYIISAVGSVRLYEMIARKLKLRGKIAYQPALALASILLLLVAPLWSAYHSGPFYSLYLNPFGQGSVAYFFPHDEIYDAGLRETIKEICETAPHGASVGGESPSVFNYYFAKFGRTDLHYFNLSDPVDQNKALDGAWVVVQDGRRYFENVSLISRLEKTGEPSSTVKIAGATAATIYKPHYVARNRSVE